jgi:hypothetical protein
MLQAYSYTQEEKHQFSKDHPTSTGWDRDFLDGPNWIEMTDFEISAIKYLGKFPPISTAIRM